MRLNIFRPNVWRCGITHSHRYECMGASTLISGHIAGKRSARILDAGCSEGKASRDCKMLLEKNGCAVSFVGVDQDKGRISRANKDPCGINFLCSDIESLEFENEFDVILCLNVIRHVSHESKTRILQNIARMLKPSGMLITGISRQDMMQMNLPASEPPECTKHTMFLFRYSSAFRYLSFTCNRPGNSDNDTRMIGREKVYEYAKIHAH